MPRLVDLKCKLCGKEERDRFVLVMPDKFQCGECGAECDQIWWGVRKPRTAEWSEKDAVVVFRDPQTGKYRYPGRNDLPTPAGYERVTMRSLRAVEAFEQQSGTRNEAMHFDRNGRGFDDKWKGQPFTH